MKDESEEQSLEKSKNVLEEKRKNSQHIYNNCYEFRSRAIKKQNDKDKKLLRNDKNVIELMFPITIILHCSMTAKNHQYKNILIHYFLSFPIGCSARSKNNTDQALC